MLKKIAGLPDDVIGFEAVGEVTTDDCKDWLIPAPSAAAREKRRLRVLDFLGPDFTGYSAGALWEDAKMGFHDLASWERIAVVADVEWVRRAIGAMVFAVPFPGRLFSSQELDAAKSWVDERRPNPGASRFNPKVRFVGVVVCHS